mmetsp:Transcript_499/g.1166  ORF Transcript_499/g.1166 Transcript_499/m.1166 type:complete len:216 (-) Transcript_499:2219-2866(-)
MTSAGQKLQRAQGGADSLRRRARLLGVIPQSAGEQCARRRERIHRLAVGTELERGGGQRVRQCVHHLSEIALIGAAECQHERLDALLQAEFTHLLDAQRKGISTVRRDRRHTPVAGVAARHRRRLVHAAVIECGHLGKDALHGGAELGPGRERGGPAGTRGAPTRAGQGAAVRSASTGSDVWRRSGLDAGWRRADQLNGWWDWVDRRWRRCRRGR